jgi:hypothetical protein
VGSLIAAATPAHHATLPLLTAATCNHRVDRVLGIFSQPSELGPPPPPLTRRGVCSSPFVPGGDTFTCGREDWGSQFRREDRHCCTQGIYLHLALCIKPNKECCYRRMRSSRVVRVSGRESNPEPTLLRPARYVLYYAKLHLIF